VTSRIPENRRDRGNLAALASASYIGGQARHP